MKINYDGRIELIPDRDIFEFKGFLKGINTELVREDDRLWTLLIPPDGSNTFPVDLMQSNSCHRLKIYFPNCSDHTPIGGPAPVGSWTR